MARKPTTPGANTQRVPSGKTPPSGGPDTYDGRANTAAGTPAPEYADRAPGARIVRWPKTS